MKTKDINYCKLDSLIEELAAKFSDKNYIDKSSAKKIGRLSVLYGVLKHLPSSPIEVEFESGISGSQLLAKTCATYGEIISLSRASHGIGSRIQKSLPEGAGSTFMAASLKCGQHEMQIDPCHVQGQRRFSDLKELICGDDDYFNDALKNSKILSQSVFISDESTTNPKEVLTQSVLSSLGGPSGVRGKMDEITSRLSQIQIPIPSNASNKIKQNANDIKKMSDPDLLQDICEVIMGKGRHAEIAYLEYVCSDSFAECISNSVQRLKSDKNHDLLLNIAIDNKPCAMCCMALDMASKHIKKIVDDISPEFCINITQNVINIRDTEHAFGAKTYRKFATTERLDQQTNISDNATPIEDFGEARKAGAKTVIYSNTEISKILSSQKFNTNSTSVFASAQQLSQNNKSKIPEYLPSLDLAEAVAGYFGVTISRAKATAKPNDKHVISSPQLDSRYQFSNWRKISENKNAFNFKIEDFPQNPELEGSPDISVFPKSYSKIASGSECLHSKTELDTKEAAFQLKPSDFPKMTDVYRALKRDTGHKRICNQTSEHIGR